MDFTNVTNAQNYYNDLVKRGILLPGSNLCLDMILLKLPKMKIPSTQYWQRMGTTGSTAILWLSNRTIRIYP